MASLALAVPSVSSLLNRIVSGICCSMKGISSYFDNKFIVN